MMKVKRLGVKTWSFSLHSYAFPFFALSTYYYVSFRLHGEYLGFSERHFLSRTTALFDIKYGKISL